MATGLKPDCFRCTHAIVLTPRGWACDAFEQIPLDVLSRKRLHTSEIEGDGGLRFKAKKPQEEGGYQAVSKDEMRCENCSLFLAPRGCRILLGEVSNLGWCPGWTQDLPEGGKPGLQVVADAATRPHLFLDLDGVLADFDAGYESVTSSRPDKLADDEVWKTIEQYPGFYRDLPLMPDAMVLWCYAKQFNPTILTGIPSSIPGAESDKRAWVAEKLGANVPVICCASKDKASYASPGDVLVDDWEKYKDKWTGVGGVWVTHTSATDSIEQLERVMEAARQDSVEVMPAAGVMIVTAAGKVLVLKRSDSGQWAFPGGKIEEGETPEQAAIRECEEETGFRPEVHSEWTRRSKDGVDFTTFFALIRDEFEPKLNEEHTEHRWLPVDDLASGSLRHLGLG